MSDNPKRTDPTTIGYVEFQDPQWLEEFFERAAREERPRYVRYTGRCPRCTHSIVIDVPRPPDDILLREPTEDGGDGAKEPKSEPVGDGRLRCNCEEGKESHTGEGATPTGCGVYAYAAFTE